MSQLVWGTIVPSTTSGNQLATLLNDFKEAVVSGMSGSARPSELDAGGMWVDNVNDDPIWHLYIYDGTTDILLLNIDKSTGTASAPGASSTFDITKISDDSVGPVLDFIKKRIAGGGQTQAGDQLGVMNFKGVDATDVEQIQARIRSVSTDTVTSLLTGSYVAVDVTKTGTNTLFEALRVSNEGNIGVGVTAPSKKGDFQGTDSSAAVRATRVSADAVGSKVTVKKKRVATNGQVLSGDVIGSFTAETTDQNGAEAEVHKIEVVALENHTDVAQGTEVIHSVKGTGSTVYTEVMRLSSTSFKVFGAEVAGNIVKNNYTAVADPAVTDDGPDGNYSVGSVWVNVTLDRAWICLDNTNDAAIWKRIDKERLIVNGFLTHDFGVTPVTDAAWVELVADTGADIIKKIAQIFYPAGSLLQIAVGAAASEVPLFVIPGGGLTDEGIDVEIPANSRLSMRLVSGQDTVNSGVISMNTYKEV